MARGRKTGGGSRKGKPNKATAEVQAIARGFVDDPDYRAMLKARLASGTAGTMEQILWAYAYGKPREPLDGTTLPATITITF